MRTRRRFGFDARSAWRAYRLVGNYSFQSVQGQEHTARLQEQNGPMGWRLFPLTPEETTRFEHLARAVEDVHLDFDASFADSLSVILRGLQLQLPEREAVVSVGHLLARERGVPHDVEARVDSAFLLTLGWAKSERK